MPKLTNEQINAIKYDCRELFSLIHNSKIDIKAIHSSQSPTALKIIEKNNELKNKMLHFVGKLPEVDIIEYFAYYNLPTKYGINELFNS